jgi:cell division protein FtsL
MQIPAVGPTNRFLVAQRDRRWPRVLSLVLMLATAVVVVLMLVGWPRLESTSVHYDVLRLRADVEVLQERARRLDLELETLRAPRTLSDRARELGLMPPAEAGASEETP